MQIAVDITGRKLNVATVNRKFHLPVTPLTRNVTWITLVDPKRFVQGKWMARERYNPRPQYCLLLMYIRTNVLHERFKPMFITLR